MSFLRPLLFLLEKKLNFFFFGPEEKKTVLTNLTKEAKRKTTETCDYK